MFLSLDGTFVVQLVNFAIFFAILTVVFIRPVSRAIVERRKYINSVVHDYERYQTEGRNLRTQAENIRAAARREAEQLLSHERAQASNEAGSVAADANAKAMAIVAEAERAVALELQSARANEPQTVRELANLMVDRALLEQAP